jgi:peptidoglycan/LPS O-acetylase OafA/YrhL
MPVPADQRKDPWMKMPTHAKISDLETLRGISIVLVLVAHASMLMPWGYETYLWTVKLQFGAGVDLFFVISGYVISRSIFQDIDDSGGTGRDILVRFWVRRFFRLIPAAILVLLATLACVVLFADLALFQQFGGIGHTAFGAFAGLTQWFNLWAYFQAASGQPLTLLAHYWSLSLEEQFYVVWPILVVLLPTKRALVALAVLCMIVISSFPRSGTLDLVWWFRIDSVLWGCLIYLLLPSFGGLVRLLSKRWLAGAVMLLGIVLLLAGTRLAGPGALAGTVTSFGAMLCVLVTVVNRDMLQGLGWLTVALNYLGSRSYTIYLWHVLIYTLVKAAWMAVFPGIESSASLWGSGLVVLSALPFALIIEFSYRVVEDRTRMIGRRLSDRMS